MRKLVLLLAVSFVTAGCGGDDSGGGGGGGARTWTTMRCLWTDDMCDQVTGNMTDANLADLQAACAGAGGIPASATCDTTGTVAGHCHYGDTSITGVMISGGYIDEYYYTAGAWTVLDAQSYCAIPPAGTWVP